MNISVSRATTASSRPAHVASPAGPHGRVIRMPDNPQERAVLARSLYLRLGTPIDHTVLLMRLAVAEDTRPTAIRTRVRPHKPV